MPYPLKLSTLNAIMTLLVTELQEFTAVDIWLDAEATKM
jgi:hypothetical protein